MGITFDPETMLVSSMFRGITTGNELVSSVRNVMATITADTPEPAGVHDLLLAHVQRWIYEEAAKFGLGSAQDGCLESARQGTATLWYKKGRTFQTISIYL